MTDNNHAPDGASQDTGAGEGGIGSLPPEVQTYIRSLREEAKANRIAAKQANDGLMQLQSQFQALQTTAEAEKLKTVEELQGALTARQKALTDAQTEAARFREHFQRSNESRIAAIPERYRSLVPKYEDPALVAAWLDANVSLLQSPLPSTDAGQLGPTPPTGAKLTPEEEKYAALLGVDLKTALKYKS